MRNNFRVGALVWNVDVPDKCYMILSHHKGEVRPYVGSQGRRGPGFYKAISPDGLLVEFSDISWTWELVS